MLVSEHEDRPVPHDDRKGHHYYTTPSARISCIVVMTLAVIILRKNEHEDRPVPHDDRKGHHYYTTPSARISCIVVMTLAVIILRKNMNPTRESTKT